VTSLTCASPDSKVAAVAEAPLVPAVVAIAAEEFAVEESEHAFEEFERAFVASAVAEAVAESIQAEKEVFPGKGMLVAWKLFVVPHTSAGLAGDVVAVEVARNLDTEELLGEHLVVALALVALACAEGVHWDAMALQVGGDCKWLDLA